VTTEKGIKIEMPYSDAQSLVTFFCSLRLRQQGNVFIFAVEWDKKRENIKTVAWPPHTNQIAMCFDALSITKEEKFKINPT
jgi:hypothetical protein